MIEVRFDCDETECTSSVSYHIKVEWTYSDLVRELSRDGWILYPSADREGKKILVRCPTCYRATRDRIQRRIVTRERIRE